MGFIEAIILGLIQGLTEFLPISSTAHLRIAGEFLPSATDPGATFTAITQIGTELAVILYFRKDIARILGRWFRQFRRPKGAHSDAPYCMQCGVQMQRAGSCHACPSCGSTSGCS